MKRIYSVLWFGLVILYDSVNGQKGVNTFFFFNLMKLELFTSDDAYTYNKRRYQFQLSNNALSTPP